MNKRKESGRIEEDLVCTSDQMEEMRAETNKIFGVQVGQRLDRCKRLTGGLFGD